MQKLAFQASWAKALSNNDRKLIEKIFLETNESENYSILLSPIRQATNHKGELLITVLIHNFTPEAISFSSKKLAYLENNLIIAEHIFTQTTLVIQPKVSMPWTFIFSVSSLKNTAKLINGQIKIT